MAESGPPSTRHSVTLPSSSYSPSREDVELTTFTQDEARTPIERQEFSLPRADGGKDAWLVLFSCFVLEGLVWGFPFAFGVFQDYYSRQPLFKGSTSSIAAIGTTSTGIMYFGAPVVYSILRRYPRLRKPFCITGYILLLIAIVGASFAQTLSQLLATQGVLYAVGGSIHYFPAFLYLDEWFVTRKGLAYGVVWAGGGAAGVVLPLTLEWLLAQWGFRTALRVWAGVTFVLTTPAIFFLKGRLPVQHASTGPQKVETGFLLDPTFWVFQAGNVIQGLGYFLPTLYMPSFARAIGLTPVAGTLAVSLTNGATMIGAVMAGWLVDRYPVTTAINVCAVGTVGAVFLCWSFAIHAPVLYVFALLYGTFAGGFASTWAGVAGALRKKCPGTETGMIIALMAAGKGLGSVISGPLSGAMVETNLWRGGMEFAWGSGYGLLILFSGATAAVQGVGWCGKKFGVITV